jgi:hypothetical protein
MTKLGTWPQDIYYLSWMTQRLANRAPEYTQARKWSWSTVQQILNPVGLEIERTYKQLVEERNNIFLSVTNIDLLDKLYRLELGIGMEFNTTSSDDGIDIYVPPTVYATINGIEHEITIAAKNDIESLVYTAVPSRLEYGEESYSYLSVIPRMTISELADATPNELPIPGHLYITLHGNTTWEYRGRSQIYYPKVYIKGVTRKGVNHQEAIPVRYNGTFRSIYQWESIEEVFTSYIDEDAELTVEVLPFDVETKLDLRNLLVPPSGAESWRFLRLGTKSFGSVLVSEGFTVSDFDVIRMGFSELDYEYEIELHDENGDPITLNAMAIKPNTDYIYAISNDKLYVYTAKLPYPDLTVLEPWSPDTKMDLYSHRWIYTRDDTVSIKTDILDLSNVPWKYRWTLREPDGTTWYLGMDGSKWSTTIDAWIVNPKWEQAGWTEQTMELSADDAGVYIVTLECLYSNISNQGKDYVLTTRFLYYVPVIEPEVSIDLPAELNSATNVAFDSDGRLWFYVSGDIYLSNVFHDYFIADYEQRAVWMRENYTSVRVVT